MAVYGAMLLCAALTISTSMALEIPQKASLLSFDAKGTKNRPVTKVITLLQDMLKQMEKEGEEDEDIYDKMACWCETNDKEKTKNIADAQAHITDLTSSIEEFTAGTARLQTEIKGLEAEVASGQKALDESTAIRQKQLAEFNAEEKDLLESVSALKAAVTVLDKSNKALLQVPKSHLLGVAATLEHEMTAHSEMLAGIISPSQRRTIGVFVQSPEDFIDTPALALNQQESDSDDSSYAPQGGEIFGILSQMKETFESNLASAQTEETANQKAYESVKQAKGEEINAAQAQLDTKNQEVADTMEKNGQSKQDQEDTSDSLAEDQEFMTMLKEKCSSTDSEWQARQKTRQEETAAVSKALSILSSDDSHDLFSKTFNPAFLQVDNLALSKRRLQASKLLVSVAQKNSNPALSTLAESVQLNAFTKVLQAIDGMMVQLKKEKGDEVKQRDFCIDELNTNALQTEKKARERADVNAQTADLESSIKSVGDNIDGLKAEVSELQTQTKRAGEDRAKQAKEFKMTVADQKATQKLLTQAITVLNSFYANKGAAASLVQKGRQPSGFSAYKKSTAGAGVTAMIQQVINDAKAMEAEAVNDEETSQQMYEGFVKRANSSTEKKNKDIIHKSKVKAKAESDLVQGKTDKEAVLLAMEQLSNSAGQLHGSCDFVTKNFEIRQTARDEEVEALKQAKAILGGAKFTDF